MEHLTKLILNLVNHLENECIIVEVNISELENKHFYEIVVWLKTVLKEQYPKSKLKPMMKSIHYANNFKDEKLKQSAYILDEIEQYLTINAFLKHDSSVAFFNNKITTKDFVVTSENLVATAIESLMLAKKRKFLICDDKFMKEKTIKICDECESEYFAETSKMDNLCPNCAHYLYGYDNCNHKFENGRCINCYLDEKIYKKIMKIKL